MSDIDRRDRGRGITRGKNEEKDRPRSRSRSRSREREIVKDQFLEILGDAAQKMSNQLKTQNNINELGAEFARSVETSREQSRIQSQSMEAEVDSQSNLGLMKGADEIQEAEEEKEKEKNNSTVIGLLLANNVINEIKSRSGSIALTSTALAFLYNPGIALEIINKLSPLATHGSIAIIVYTLIDALLNRQVNQKLTEITTYIMEAKETVSNTSALAGTAIYNVAKPIIILYDNVTTFISVCYEKRFGLPAYQGDLIETAKLLEKKYIIERIGKLKEFMKSKNEILQKIVLDQIDTLDGVGDNKSYIEKITIILDNINNNPDLKKIKNVDEKSEIAKFISFLSSQITCPTSLPSEDHLTVFGGKSRKNKSKRKTSKSGKKTRKSKKSKKRRSSRK